jgi:hypothetical protein
MPIRTRFPVNKISEKEFYSLDYQVMGIVFEIPSAVELQVKK